MTEPAVPSIAWQHALRLATKAADDVFPPSEYAVSASALPDQSYVTLQLEHQPYKGFVWRETVRIQRLQTEAEFADAARRGWQFLRGELHRKAETK